MYRQFKRIQREMFATRHDQKKGQFASCYKSFKNFRIVLDTTEIRIEIPYHYEQQGNTFSTYKAGNVILYIVGTLADGSIGFISPGFEGSISDRELFCEKRNYRLFGRRLVVGR